MKTVIYGDSLAGPFGLINHKAWSKQLMEQKDSTIERVVYKNGYTTSDLIECLGREVLNFKPEQVVLICGTNDALQGRSAKEILDSVQFLGNEIKKAQAKSVWLIPPQLDGELAAKSFGDPIRVFDRTNEELLKLRKMVRALKDFFLILDLEDFRKSYKQDSKGKVYVDGIHFHRNFQDALTIYLSRVLDNRKA